MTTEIDVTRKRGDTKRLTFVIKDDNGASVDVSGWVSFTFTVTEDKVPLDATNQIQQFTGQLSTDGTDGRIYFVPTGTEPVGKLYYDIQAIDDNSEKVTIAEGTYVVTQDRNKD